MSDMVKIPSMRPEPKRDRYSTDRAHKTAVARWGQRTLKTRILGKVFVDFSTGCWMWTAALDNCGYGQVFFEKGPVKAHIAVFRIYNGAVPEGLTLDHLCRNIHCVNPEHLEPTTRSENTRRQFAAAGHPRANQTHCVNGHLLSGDNLRPNSQPGHRTCRLCRADANRRYRARMKAASA